MVAVNDPASGSNKVLRVEYPAGSRNPEANPQGGLGFKADPLSIDGNVKKVRLEYSVYFPKSFDFVRGGKLPGLYGGNGDCTGGSDSKGCFTARLMWREDGIGEVYAYLPESKQSKELCEDDNNICNPDYGFSIGRGTFQFKKGEWNHITETITMNTPGKQNGVMTLTMNGKKVIDEKNIVYRTNTNGRVVGIMFHTFFGGNDDSWSSTKNQFAYFKNFGLVAMY
ncbi:hypothetical protein BDB01DRAFT_787526 [Pilobolus umbonatus]|nr:hypothetical protein BDB01DRAFT_787526 [Pilobolus umbonatus]